MKRGKDRRRATLIWRENSATHFPVASGTHEEMMQLNYDGGCPPYASNCLTWPLKCSSHALTYDAALPQQRWRNDVLRTVVKETGCGSVLPPLRVGQRRLAGPSRKHRADSTNGDGAVTARQAKCAGGRRRRLLIGLPALAPKYNHLTARLLYHPVLSSGWRPCALSPRGSATSWTPATSVAGNSRRRRPSLSKQPRETRLET